MDAIEVGRRGRRILHLEDVLAENFLVLGYVVDYAQSIRVEDVICILQVRTLVQRNHVKHSLVHGEDIGHVVQVAEEHVTSQLPVYIDMVIRKYFQRHVLRTVEHVHTRVALFLVQRRMGRGKVETVRDVHFQKNALK